MHLWGGHTTAAFRTGIQMTRSDPDEPGLRSFLADLALQAGECRTAVTEARRALNLSSNPETLAYYFMAKTILGFSLQLCGEPSHAIPHLEEARDRLLTRFAAGMQQPLEVLELGALFFALGDQESARNWIQEAYEAGSRHVGFLRTHPIFLGLRSDPQVVEIMSRMQEDVDRMRARVAEAADTTVSG